MIGAPMPIYDYHCDHCGHAVPAAIVFKGSGWYKTDSRPAEKTESKPETKSDSKPETKPDAKSEGKAKPAGKSSPKSEASS
jgi:predicted nucleic acid-binding Zn ribbon protein